MLTQEEMRLLAWLAPHSPVVGDIVDLGSFLGGSAVSHALGASRSRIRRKVHAYDVFEINETLAEQFLTTRGRSCDGLVASNDALPVFKHFTLYFANLIDTRVGDVIDAVKQSDRYPVYKYIKDHPNKRPYSHRVFPVIVQQDFLLYQSPWRRSNTYKVFSAALGK